MQAFEFPSDFRTQDIATNGTTIHVRSGGSGPAVVLLHGYGETGDMWAPMAFDLARDRTSVVSDLRGTVVEGSPRRPGEVRCASCVAFGGLTRNLGNTPSGAALLRIA